MLTSPSPFSLTDILLTTDPFQHPPPPHSLIKLTDFGLSRFVDPAAPQLTTLCGSDSYAAPELVMGRAYDGRATDAWACGVVLYALATKLASRIAILTLTLKTKSGNDLNEQNMGSSTGCSFD